MSFSCVSRLQSLFVPNEVVSLRGTGLVLFSSLSRRSKFPKILVRHSTTAWTRGASAIYLRPERRAESAIYLRPEGWSLRFACDQRGVSLRGGGVCDLLAPEGEVSLRGGGVCDLLTCPQRGGGGVGGWGRERGRLGRPLSHPALATADEPPHCPWGLGT